MSDISAIVSTSSTAVTVFSEIARLAKIFTENTKEQFTQKEKNDLLSYFTKNQDQKADALSALDVCETNSDKLAYLRSLLTPGMFYHRDSILIAVFSALSYLLIISNT